MRSKLIAIILFLCFVTSRVHGLVLNKQSPYLRESDEEELAESQDLVERRKLTVVKEDPEEEKEKKCRHHIMRGENFFLIIVASFIGALIGIFLKNLFINRKRSGIQRRLKGEAHSKEKVLKARMLSKLNDKIHRGENKVIKYVNAMLLDPHKIQLKPRKLLGEVLRVRKYLDESGFELPDQLTARNLYQITKNVFWNLHQFNLDSRGKMAKKVINTLYTHREPVFTAFTDSINGI